VARARRSLGPHGRNSAETVPSSAGRSRARRLSDLLGARTWYLGRGASPPPTASARSSVAFQHQRRTSMDSARSSRARATSASRATSGESSPRPLPWRRPSLGWGAKAGARASQQRASQPEADRVQPVAPARSLTPDIPGRRVGGGPKAAQRARGGRQRSSFADFRHTDEYGDVWAGYGI